MSLNQTSSEDKAKTTQNNKNEKLTKYNILGIPSSIVIGDKTYVFKKQLKSDDNNTFTYRFQKYKYRIPINIIILLI